MVGRVAGPPRQGLAASRAAPGGPVRPARRPPVSGALASNRSGDDSTNDVNTLGGILVAGMKVSDMLSFEGGFGYISNDPDDADNGFDEKTNAWDAYVQSVIALAPGVYIIPEVGYRDLGNNPEDEDQGTEMYLGAKWQINF